MGIIVSAMVGVTGFCIGLFAYYLFDNSPGMGIAFAVITTHFVDKLFESV
jgi:hypothetical protein